MAIYLYKNKNTLAFKVLDFTRSYPNFVAAVDVGIKTLKS